MQIDIINPNSKYHFNKFSEQVDMFNLKFEQILKNLGKQDLFDPDQIQKELINVRNNSQQLLTILISTLGSYAPNKLGRGNSHGRYASMNGLYRPLITKLQSMIPHLNVAIEANKSMQNPDAKATFTAKEILEHRKDLSDIGLKDFGDGLYALLVLAVLVQKLLSKREMGGNSV